MRPKAAQPPEPAFSRRDFLKLGGVGIAACLSAASFTPASATNTAGFTQGRVLEESTNVFDTPSFSGQVLGRFWKDSVLPITRSLAGDPLLPHNRIWHHINPDGGPAGYIHSNTVQPVQTRLNAPVAEIPPEGALGEITVPYTDAHAQPTRDSQVVYRYYYKTTYWITSLVTDEQGAGWYQTVEDKWDDIFYIPAAHVRMISAAELTPLSPELPLAAKRLEIRTEAQTVVAYEWGRPVFTAKMSSGAQLADGDYRTPTGHYETFHKRPSRHMAQGNLTANGYDLPGVPWVVYFTEEGLSVHGTYWHNDYGRPRSHGCINLTPQAAQWVFRWTMPVVPHNQQRIRTNYGTILDVV